MKRLNTLLSNKLSVKHKSLLVINGIALFGLFLFPPFVPILFVLTLTIWPLIRLGLFGRLLAGIFLYAVSGAMLLEFTTLLHLESPYTLLGFLLLVGLSIVQWKNDSEFDIQTSPSDVAGLLVGLVTFITLFGPLIGASNSKILQYLIGGEDNNSHFQMFRYVLTEKHYAYSNDVAESGIRPSLLSYAQGSHAAMAMIAEPFDSSNSVTGQLRQYTFLAAATFAATFWASYLCAVQSLRFIKNKGEEAILSIISAPLFIILMPLGIFLHLYTYGYYAHYFSYLALAMLFLVLVTYDKKRQVLHTTTMAALTFYGIFASWYLLAPIAVLPVIAFAWGSRKTIFTKTGLISILIAFAACLYLAYVYLFTSFDGAGHLLTTGGVEKFSAKWLLVSLPAVGIALYAVYKKQLFEFCLAGTVIISATMTAMIGILQRHKLGHYDYYFYKTLFTVLFVSMLYYSYHFTYWFADRLRKSMWNSLLASAGLALLCFMFVSTNSAKYLMNFRVSTQELTQQADNRVLDVFTDDKTLVMYSDAIVLTSCNPYTDFTGVIWAGGFYLPYNQERGEIENSMLSHFDEFSQYGSSLLTDIANYAKTQPKPVALYTKDKNCINADVLNSSFADSNVQIISL